MRARRALARAKAVGEEYEGVEVATATVRARRAGEAIVHEAKRRGVEAIVLAAEEPTGIRGGLRLGGKQGLHDTFVGDTTRYVLQKATVPRDPHRAAVGQGGGRPDGAGRGRRAGAPGRPSARRRRAGAAGSLESPLAMFVLVVGAGRVGSSVATSALRAGHTVSVLDEDPLSHERLDVELGAVVGGGRRALHDRHGARARRADRGRDRGRRRLHRLDQRRQHQPRRLPARPAALRGAAGDRAHPRPAPRGLVRRAGRAHGLPDADRDRAAREGRARTLMAGST